MSLFQLYVELVAADRILEADDAAGHREAASLARLEAARFELVGAFSCAGFEFQTMIEEGPTHWIALGMRRAISEDDTATFVRLTLDMWQQQAIAYAARFNGHWMVETPSAAKNLVQQVLRPDEADVDRSLWVSANQPSSLPRQDESARSDEPNRSVRVQATSHEG